MCELPFNILAISFSMIMKLKTAKMLKKKQMYFLLAHLFS